MELFFITTAAQYLTVPRAPAEPVWAGGKPHVEPRTGNSSVWPYGPLSTKGRDIINARGDVITWAGVNWPLNLESMIPEGLEWVSAEEILDQVASVGFNFIRMWVISPALYCLVMWLIISQGLRYRDDRPGIRSRR